MKRKKFLLLTASFGEGHNSAARSIKLALEQSGKAEVIFVDLYANASPQVNRVIQGAYSMVINRYPAVWTLVFKWLERPGWMESSLWTAVKLRDELDRLIVEHHPDAIVATYPLYAYLYRDIQKSRLGVDRPFTTIVTDSGSINSAWFRCRSDAFLVADDETRELLVSNGVPDDTVHAFGFPLDPGFPVGAESGEDDGPPWRVLFMPSTQLALTLRKIKALLAVPDIELTILAGRHAKIFDGINESGLASGPRCKLIGWTDQIPQLLCSHHLFIGKAGGAIVQEALAARCPFLVSHVVPGQEEGNIALLERLGVGAVAAKRPSQLAYRVRQLIAEDAREWRIWKTNLAKHSKPPASERIAQFLLKQTRSKFSGIKR